MTTQRGWSHKSPPNVRRVRALVACAVVVFVTATRADQPRPRPLESAAPNQSLALDPPQPIDRVEKRIEPDASRVEPDDVAVRQTSVTERDDTPIAANTKRASRLPGAVPRRSLVDALRADAGATPWYRGGVGATGIVVGLILLLFLCVRRWLPKTPPPDSATLRVAARVALTPRHSLALVQVGRRFLVLGLSPDQVSGVCDIQDEAEVAELKAHFGAGRPPSRRFDAFIAAQAETFSRDDRAVADRHNRTTPRATDRSSTTADRSSTRAEHSSIQQPGSMEENESWKSLTDLRRRIHALSNRARPTAGRVQ